MNYMLEELTDILDDIVPDEDTDTEDSILYVCNSLSYKITQSSYKITQFIE